MYSWPFGGTLILAGILVGVSSTILASDPDPDEPLKQIARDLATQARHHRLSRVAVEPFTDLEGHINQLGRFLAAEVATELEASHGMQIVDPSQLAAYLKHYKAMRLSELPRDDLQKVSKQLRLDGIIAGSVVESANHLRLTAKLIAIRTSMVVTVARMTFAKTGFLAELVQPPANLPPSTQRSETAAVPESAGDAPEGMTLIPAGPFVFGDGQQHTETLAAFWIDLYEVTNGQYAKLRAIEFPDKRAEHPVTNVSWHHARQFCAAMGKRLPTEQEWEKAARGMDGRLYPWGNWYDAKHANAENRVGDAMAVGRFEDGRSPYGVYDMAGNVMEWTDSGDELTKVFRGGSWASSAQEVRAVTRSSLVPGYRLLDLGFRCAKDGPQQR
jgi:formylglycine-generating enzyme required for sulfatase activity